MTLPPNLPNDLANDLALSEAPPPAAGPGAAFDILAPIAPGLTSLEASAGTGKTYTMTGLILRHLIVDGIPLGEILAVTFTQAATAEITARLHQRLHEAQRLLQSSEPGMPETLAPSSLGADPILAHILNLSRTDGPMIYQRRVEAALAAFDRAPIMTIHAFCQRALQRHAVDANAPLHWRLVDDERPLMEEAITKAWLQWVDREPPERLQALLSLGLDHSAMRRLGLLALENPDATPEPPPGDCQWPPSPPEAEAQQLTEALRALSECARDRELLAAFHGDSSRLMHRLGLKAWRWKKVLAALQSLGHGSLSLEDRLQLEHLDPQMAFGPPEEILTLIPPLRTFLQAHRQLSLWASQARAAFTMHVRAIYDASLEAQGLWGYGHLIRRLRDALSPAFNPTAARFRERLAAEHRLILIDEFQDTDPNQWEIFRRLYLDDDKRLVVIGDPKQAIYGFRQADLQISADAKDRATRRHHLDRNYRSDAPLISALNHLFSYQDPETAFANAAIPYQEIAAAHPARVTGLKRAPIHLLWLTRHAHNTGRYFSASAKLDNSWVNAELPHLIAADIAAFLADPPTLHGDSGSRRASARDCAILVQTNAQGIALQEALRARQIPVAIHSPKSVFSTDEAMVLLHTLRAIDDPSQLRQVRAALTGPLMGYSAAEIAEWEAREAPEFEVALDRLRRWRGIWREEGFFIAFRDLMGAQAATLIAQTQGVQRLTNMHHLGERLNEAAERLHLRPLGLLHWLEQQIYNEDRARGQDQLRFGTDDDAVQVLTIHKSKGLEYGFVWCPYLWQSADPWLRDRADDFCARMDDGVQRLYLHLDGEDPTRKEALQASIYALRTERIRTAYVALTRAKYALNMVGGAFWDLPTSPLGYWLFSSRMATDARGLEASTRELSQKIRSWPDRLFIDEIGDNLSAELVSVSALQESPQPTGRAYGGLTLQALSWPADRTLELHWRRTSFSGLTGETRSDELSPEIQGLDEEGAPTPELGEARVLLAEIPRGAQMGNALHYALENMDFSELGGLQPLVETGLRLHGLETVDAPLITEAFEDLVRTPIDAAGLTLAEIPQASQLAEMDFVFPVAGGRGRAGGSFSHGNLIDILLRFGGPRVHRWIPAFQQQRFADVQGFLSGSLDLVFQSPVDGRYYLADWKSNFLGEQVKDYRPAALEGAMIQHHYYLQYHIYSLALRRHLRQQLPDFDHERDFGGAFYFFIRGMASTHPPGYGVFHDRPSAQLLDALDRLIDQGQSVEGQGRLL